MITTKLIIGMIILHHFRPDNTRGFPFSGAVIIVSGSFLVAIQRFGGVNLRHLTRAGFDRVVGAVTKTRSSGTNSGGAYHPMGEGLGSGKLFTCILEYLAGCLFDFVPVICIFEHMNFETILENP